MKRKHCESAFLKSKKELTDLSELNKNQYIHSNEHRGNDQLFRLGGGKVKKKVAPLPHEESAQTEPSWRLMTRLTVASPTPVPENSEAACNRWNGSNSLSA